MAETKGATRLAPRCWADDCEEYPDLLVGHRDRLCSMHFFEIDRAVRSPVPPAPGSLAARWAARDTKGDWLGGLLEVEP